MRKLPTILIRRMFLAGGLLLLTLVASLPVATRVDARLVGGCRKDPVVFLSNGVRIQMTAVIATEESNVAHVTYTVHAPAGTEMTRLLYPGGPHSENETVVFLADQPAGQYTIDTVVEVVSGDPVDVTALTKIRNARGESSGLSGEHLAVSMEISE